MFTDIWSRRAGWLGMVGLVLFSGTLVQAQVSDRAIPAPERPTPLLDDREADAEGEAKNQPSEYWIGVATSDELINDTTRAQLGLEKGHGIAVLSVREESPAAQAGLRENDVLVKAGNRDLKTIQDLVEAVEAAKGQELPVVLYREGKQQTLTVTPAKRPADLQRTPQEAFRSWVQRRAGGPQDDVIIDRWLSGKEEGPLGMWMVRPGFVMPFGGRSQPLPENMKITITKQGKEPAKISVTRNDESWNVTEETLSELPDDVRPHVEMMLSRHPAGFNVRVNPPNVERFQLQRRSAGKSDDARDPNAAVPAPKSGGQLDEVQRQVEELRQSVEELKRLVQERNR
jgi:membrane-associated protease RseP (regulator of RpoE activity)